MLDEKRRSEILHHNISTSDCGVVAVQAITGCGYDAALAALEAHGYEDGVGTPRGGCEKALQDLGWKAELHPIETSTETPATFAVTHEYGRFLIYVEGHVMALVEGGLMNGRGSWGKRVEAVVRVTN